MGHESVPSLSPAHRRTTNPQSPPLSVSWKVHMKDEVFERTDMGWRTLLHRHQFLLFMLAILTFLCTIYLYFAITFVAGDACSSLDGPQKLLCQISLAKDIKGKKRQFGRGLLMRPSDLLQYFTSSNSVRLRKCHIQYENYGPCREDSTAPAVCREVHERPPFCRIPVPLGYQRPKLSSVDLKVIVRVSHRNLSLCGPLQKAQGDHTTAIRNSNSRDDFELLAMNNGSFRRVLDIGCNVCTHFFGDAPTISILRPNSSDTCIQNLLSEGFPGMLISSLIEHRFPQHSFDLVRCNDCGGQFGRSGLGQLAEVNRLLRPGGYFVWTPSASDEVWIEEHSGVLEKLNWTSMARLGEFALWQKAQDLEPDTYASAAAVVRVQGSEAIKVSIVDSFYLLRAALWKRRVDHYWKLLGTDFLQEVRNVMDMNADFGSFAASIKLHPMWVMNVVPYKSPEILEAVNGRGLIGAHHDWCEAFPTPPRSYDLVHGSWAISTLDARCEIWDVLLEVDRILRPGAVVILRDTPQTIQTVQLISRSLWWRVLYTYVGEEQTEQVLICLKELDDE